MIDRLSKRTALAIAAVGVLAVVLVGWFAVVSPQRSKASELDGKISESHTALQLADSLTRGAQQRQTAAEARVLAKAMPSEAQMSQILRQLSSAAKATRVRVNSVTPQAAAPLAGYEAIPMSVVVEGRYLGITNFLGRLRTQVRVGPEKVRAKGRLYSVDSIQFVGGDDQQLLQATMTLNAYRYGGAAATPANAGTAPATSDATSATPAPTQ
jgi:Tfp pilus assembly protein PilO